MYLDFLKIHKFDSFTIAGWFFLCAQMFILSSILSNPELHPFIFWSCNNFCILIAFACFRKNMQMVKGISYLGLVSQLLWVADFMSHFLGFNLSGIADYIYVDGFTYATDVSIVLHMVIPIAILVFSFKIKPTIESLAYALSYMFVLYAATILWTPPIEDVNCIFRGCTINVVSIPYTIYVWPLYATISILISYVFHKILYYTWKGVTKET